MKVTELATTHCPDAKLKEGQIPQGLGLLSLRMGDGARKEEGTVSFLQL